MHDAKMIQKLKRYEHDFFVDDVFRNCDETQVMMKKDVYNIIVMAEAWKKNHNPSYVDSFHKILDPLNRIDKLLLHEEENQICTTYSLRERESCLLKGVG